MDSKSVFSADRSMRASFWIIAVSMAAWIGIGVGATYEARVRPVVTLFEVTAIEQTPDAVLLEGRMEKSRDCLFRGLVAYIGDYRDPGQPRERLFVRFLDQPEHVEQSREPGFQPWGPWQVMRPETVSGPHFWIRVTHQCHALFETTGVYLVMEAAEVFGAPDRADAGP